MPLLVVSFCDNIIEPGKNSEAKLAENAAKLVRLQTWLEGQQPGPHPAALPVTILSTGVAIQGIRHDHGDERCSAQIFDRDTPHLAGRSSR
jgi:hypothetical protein